MLYDKYRSAKWFLEDISEAVEAYKNYERKEKELDLGTKYLMIYGVFTALYLQQEALNDFRHALKYEKVNYEKNYPEIYKIKEKQETTLLDTLHIENTVTQRVFQDLHGNMVIYR